MCCSFELQLKFIATIEIIVSTVFLGLNMNILIQLIFGDIQIDAIKNENLDERTNLSESALIFYFVIRVIYLLGELLLAIYLNFNVYKKNVNGLILWFFMTILFSVPSRCYFIGGILWGPYFATALLIFTTNLAFTAYSLIIICLYVKKLTSSSNIPAMRAQLSSNSRHLGLSTSVTDTYVDFL